MNPADEEKIDVYGKGLMLSKQRGIKSLKKYIWFMIVEKMIQF